MNVSQGNSLVVPENRVAPQVTPSSDRIDSAAVAPPPKRKRGRPRKALPSDLVLTALHGSKNSTEEKQELRKRSGRPRKNTVQSNPAFETEAGDLDFFGESTSFYDDELSTLEEFEKITKSLQAEMQQKTRKRSDSIKRVDHPEKTPNPVALPRRAKVARRRQIDPATCERDYTREEVEFMNALNEYKRSSGRMFPTCSEILEVLRNLGYEKQEMLDSDESA